MTIPLEIDPEKDALFVRLFLQTGDPLDACIRSQYRVIGYEARTVAQYMLERPEIQLALKTAETLKPKAPVEITRESIVSDLEGIASKAIAESDYTPAIAAKKLQASLCGFLQENVTVTHRMDMSSLTDEQLEKLIAAKGKHTIEGQFTEVPQGLGQLSAPK